MIHKHALPTINPFALAKKNWSGQYPCSAAHLSALADIISTSLDGNNLLLALKIYIDAQGQCVLSGQIAGALNLFCARCMHPLTYTYRSDFCLTPVCSDEQAKHVMATTDYDPIQMQDNTIALSALVSEEILLHLPMFVYHQLSDCVSPGTKMPSCALPDEKKVADKQDKLI